MTYPLMPLGEVLKERKEAPQAEALENGEIQIVSKIGFNDGKIQLRFDGATNTGMILIRPGDLVVSGINAAKGAIAIYGEGNTKPIAATIHYGAYLPNKNKVDVRYLWWLLRSRTFKELLLEYVPGGIKTELKAKRFLPVPIPLPSLHQQKRIVGWIEELALKICAASALRDKANEDAEALVPAAMKEMFNFDRAESTVRNFAKVQGGFAFQSGSYDEHGSHQVVRIGNVRDGYLDLSRAPVRWSPTEDSRVLKYELNSGDLIISMTGTRNKRDYGFVARTPEYSKLLLNQRVGRFVVHGEVDHDYLFQFLRSPFFRDRLFPLATGTANQANVGNGDIESVKFAPPSLPVQHRVVAELHALQMSVERLKCMQTETAAELDVLLPSILDKAFRGNS